MSEKKVVLQDACGFTLEIVGLIGAGAYGRVFKALRRRPAAQFDASPILTQDGDAGPSDAPPSSPTVVAVKEVPFDDDGDEPSDLLKELSIMASIGQCDFLVEYISSFVANGVELPEGTISASQSERRGHSSAAADPSNVALSTSPAAYIVQQYVEGGTVSELLALQRQEHAGTGGRSPKAGLTEEQISCVAVDVIQALAYLHDDCRVLHRDVKCANILVSVVDGKSRLCDFGTGGRHETIADRRMTMIGTPGWMAPEVWSGGGIAHSFPSDIWALGVTVVEMTLHEPPATDPLFSQYVQALSTLPCSFISTAQREAAQDESDADVAQSSLQSASAAPAFNRAAIVGNVAFKQRFSSLDSLLSCPLLLDFVTCCLRRDPALRPTARELLNHPMIVENGSTNNNPRKIAIVRRLADVILSRRNTAPLHSVKALPHISHPPHGPPHTLQQLFHHECDNATARAARGVAAYSLCLPASISAMLTSDAFKGALPSQVQQQQQQKVMVASKTPQSAAQGMTSNRSVNDIFNDVVVPATLDSRVTMQRIFSIYRTLGSATSHTHSTTANGVRSQHAQLSSKDRDPKIPYDNSELQMAELSFEKHEVLMDRLLRAFHRVEHLRDDLNELRSRLGQLHPNKEVCNANRAEAPTNIPPHNPEESCSLRACQWLTSYLLTNNEDAEALKHVVAYFDDLKVNPFRHHHTKLYAAQGASPSRPRSVVPDASEGATKSSPAESCRATFRSQRDICVAAPFVPCSVVTTRGVGSTAVASTTSSAAIMDPAALLYNRWLTQYKERAMAVL